MTLFEFSTLAATVSPATSTTARTRIQPSFLEYARCLGLTLAKALTQVQNDFFITGSEDGSVCKFSLETNALDEVLVRCSLPIRDLALSPDGEWVAVASEYVVRCLIVRRNHTDDGVGNFWSRLSMFGT